MKRRALLAIAAALVVTTTAAYAATETKTVPAEKIFTFLPNYYGLPAAERSQFHLAYGLMVQGAKPDQITLTLHDGANTIRIAPDAQGFLMPQPTAAQLKAKAKLTFSRPDGAKFGVSLNVIPNQAPAQTMDAQNLAVAINQASAGSKKLAGIMAMAIPTLDSVDILGVTSGDVKLANGTVKPLRFIAATVDKKGNKHPAHINYTPTDYPGAVTLSFNTVPSRILIGSRD